MRIHLRSAVSRAMLGAAATSLAVLAAAAPAQAHEAPKRGTTCAVSGMTEIVHGRVYVCTAKTAAVKPRWGAGKVISRSPLTVSDGWAKAATTGMSAAFGMVKNPTSMPIRIVGAFSTYSKVVQLHEVVDKDGAMVMQQKTGGFVIPAGGMLELKPGGNHLMFLKITKPIKPGTLVPVTLVTSTGALMRTNVLGKVYNGANEDYSSGSSSMTSMSGM